jgi:hypothetical protein
VYNVSNSAGSEECRIGVLGLINHYWAVLVSEPLNRSALYDGISLNGTPLGSSLDRIARMQGEALAFADLIEGNRNDYQVIADLTDAVHVCMDEIKIKANIRYKEK